METSLACRTNHPPRRRAAVVLGITLAIFGFAGPGHAAGPIIQASNYEYVAPGGGSSLTVAAGTEVMWIASGDPHTVTSGAPGAIDNRFVDHPASEGLLLNGGAFSSVFTAPGSFPYFCEIHPEQMFGVVNVTPAVTPAPTPLPTPAPTPSRTPAPAVLPSPPSSTAAPPSQTASAAPSDVQIGGSAIPSQSASPSIEPTSRGGNGESGAGPLAIAALLAVVAAAGIALAAAWRRRRRP